MATQDGRDGQNGYGEAAEHVKDSHIRSWFNEQSLQRAQFAGKLEAHVQRLGKHDPDRKGSVSGTLHRKWFELKEKFSGSDESVFAEVERGEDNAKHTYTPHPFRPRQAYAGRGNGKWWCPALAILAARC